MRYPTMIVLSSCLLAAAPASADQPLDCSRRSLANAVAAVREKDPVITVHRRLRRSDRDPG